MKSIVKKGIQGTAMPAHPDITDDQLNTIMSFVGKMPPNMQRQWDWPYLDLQRNQDMDDMGKTIFLTTCADCHGDDGRARTDDQQDPHIWPKPANFHARNSEVGRLYHIISVGRPGTMMGAQQPKFQSEKPRWALAQYVQKFFDKNSDYQIPTGTFEQYKNPYTVGDAQIVSRGGTLAVLNCTYCHGGGMAGTWLAPDNTDRQWRYGGGTDNFVFQIVKEGLPGKLMPPNEALPENDRWAIITYLRANGGLPDPMEQLQAPEVSAK